MQQANNVRRSRSGSLESPTDSDVGDYLLLSSSSDKKAMYARRRHLRFAAMALLVLVSMLLVWIWLFLKGRIGLAVPILRALAKDSGLPPLYSEYHQLELGLPQHGASVNTSDGRQVKYLWIANHVRGANFV